MKINITECLEALKEEYRGASLLEVRPHLGTMAESEVQFDIYVAIGTFSNWVMDKKSLEEALDEMRGDYTNHRKPKSRFVEE